jgi:hypothetical protein
MSIAFDDVYEILDASDRAQGKIIERIKALDLSLEGQDLAQTLARIHDKTRKGDEFVSAFYLQSVALELSGAADAVKDAGGGPIVIPVWQQQKRRIVAVELEAVINSTRTKGEREEPLGLHPILGTGQLEQRRLKLTTAQWNITQAVLKQQLSTPVLEELEAAQTQFRIKEHFVVKE